MYIVYNIHIYVHDEAMRPRRRVEKKSRGKGRAGREGRWGEGLGAKGDEREKRQWGV